MGWAITRTRTDLTQKTQRRHRPMTRMRSSGKIKTFEMTEDRKIIIINVHNFFWPEPSSTLWLICTRGNDRLPCMQPATQCRVMFSSYSLPTPLRLRRQTPRRGDESARECGVYTNPAKWIRDDGRVTLTRQERRANITTSSVKNSYAAWVGLPGRTELFAQATDVRHGRIYSCNVYTYIINWAYIRDDSRLGAVQRV